jgi:arylsulfatase A-like enzyme
MPAAKPNIIFCHTDQLHHQAFSHLGNPWLSTPCYDEMAADGMTFSRAISSNPVCCPARSSWYTGRMSSEHGVFFNGVGTLQPDLPDLGKLLGAAGYDCYYGGKWHIPGREAKESFQIIYPYISVGERNDEALAATGEAFLKNYKPGDKPFFLNLGFMNPHDCCYLWMNTDGDAFKTGMEALVGDKNLPPLPPNYNAQVPLPSAGKDWTPDQMRLFLYTYYRMAEAGDAAIGRVYRAFKESPFFENTVFIWGADHGEMMCEHNRFGKNFAWEASQRVPLKVVAKGRVAPGSTDDSHWIQGVDISATICDLAGAGPIPDATVARSFVPFLDGKKETPWGDYAVAETNVPNVIVSFRHQDTKSVFYLGLNQVEFYDTGKDPWEMNNLAANGANPPGLDQHRAFLADYQAKTKPLPAYLAAAATGVMHPGGARRKKLGAGAGEPAAV